MRTKRLNSAMAVAVLAVDFFVTKLIIALLY